MFRKPLLLSLPVIVALALIPARASTIEYNLTADQCTGRCGPSGTIFGTITLTDTVANTVRVKIRLASDYEFSRTGVPATIVWDLVGNPTIFANDLPSGWSLLSPTAGSLPMTTKDDFKYGLSWNARNAWFTPPHSDGPLNFTLTGAGLSTSSFEGTSSNHFFAVDIYNAATCAPEGGKTGIVEAPGPQFGTADTPEPGSFVLLGGGLVTFAWMLRKRPKR
jgi:hypothetical protein